MKRPVVILLWVVLLLVAGGYPAQIQIGDREDDKAVKYNRQHPQTAIEATYPNVFFNAEHFSTNAVGNISKPSGIKTEGARDEIRAVVVPHHLLAHELIHEVFSLLQENNPSSVLLIGPNHFNRGAKIATSPLKWETPFGKVKTHGDKLRDLLSYGLAQEDAEVFYEEHSMGNLMPFIKLYLPQASVIPIILHHDVSQEEAWRLSRHLVNLMDDDTIMVASVDFSHYLTREEAEKKDVETMEALRTGNIGRIFSMGNDHLDSPASMGVLMYAMEGLDICDFIEINNTNSGVILDNDMVETTSYMTLTWSSPAL